MVERTKRRQNNSKYDILKNLHLCVCNYILNNPPKRLTRSFYEENDTLYITQSLLHSLLWTRINNQLTVGRISEVEAYQAGPESSLYGEEQDTASHAYSLKPTKRTYAIFEQGGTAYIYTCYGIHTLINISVQKKSTPHCILIRAVSPLVGIKHMLRRRELLISTKFIKKKKKKRRRRLTDLNIDNDDDDDTDEDNMINDDIEQQHNYYGYIGDTNNCEDIDRSKSVASDNLYGIYQNPRNFSEYGRKKSSDYIINRSESNDLKNEKKIDKKRFSKHSLMDDSQDRNSDFSISEKHTHSSAKVSSKKKKKNKDEDMLETETFSSEDEMENDQSINTPDFLSSIVNFKLKTDDFVIIKRKASETVVEDKSKDINTIISEIDEPIDMNPIKSETKPIMSSNTCIYSNSQVIYDNASKEKSPFSSSAFPYVNNTNNIESQKEATVTVIKNDPVLQIDDAKLNDITGGYSCTNPNNFLQDDSSLLTSKEVKSELSENSKDAILVKIAENTEPKDNVSSVSSSLVNTISNFDTNKPLIDSPVNEENIESLISECPLSQNVTTTHDTGDIKLLSENFNITDNNDLNQSIDKEAESKFSTLEPNNQNSSENHTTNIIQEPSITSSKTIVYEKIDDVIRHPTFINSLCRGPGCLCQCFGITKLLNNTDTVTSDELYLTEPIDYEKLYQYIKSQKFFKDIDEVLLTHYLESYWGVYNNKKHIHVIRRSARIGIGSSASSSLLFRFFIYKDASVTRSTLNRQSIPAENFINSENRVCPNPVNKN